MKTSSFKTLAALLATLVLSITVYADPCGMVPPIFTGNQSPITRIGLQKTYVFFKDGVETFVIRPGFSGKVDNFGMLIPFPAPPELRKVPDNVFSQIANAIDPPEVVVDLSPRPMAAMARGGAIADSAIAENALDFRQKVTVLKQEAVGMYEVAVLEAGSAEALKTWMDQNGYKYPEGMDKVTNEYVDSGWCFVAVKTKVGQKKAVDPQPGQREINAQLPEGSVFDGNVQGMGFRFKTDELVVPMRLSAFNDGELRNVVYLLTDGPRRIRSIPEEYVVRQIPGDQLFDNVTKPLPLRIIGGTEKDIPEYQRKNLAQRRDPEPKNGVAKELFAADLLAVATGNLSLEHEEQEKELLRIGEYFGLRGGEVDAENLDALATARKRTTEQGLSMLKEMTMTVVDGDFPREIIANQNLTFAQYNMPAARNTNLNYDANRFGPGVQKKGTLKLGAIDWYRVHQEIVQEHRNSRNAIRLVLALALMGMVVSLVPRKSKLVAVVVVAMGLATGSAMATPISHPNSVAVSSTHAVKPTASFDELIDQLGNSKTAKSAIEAIAKKAKSNQAERDALVQSLLKVVKGQSELPQKGWAIAALAEIGGQDVDEYLLNIHADESQPQLVRTWAAAARVSMTRTVNGLIEKANLISTFPALGRPIGMRIVEQMTSGDDQGDPEKIIGVTQKVPQLQTALAPAIMAFGPQQLAEVAFQSGNNITRRTAAGYLGSLATQGNAADVAETMIEQVKFNPQANEVPWKGGALFVPGIQWSQEDARGLVGNLIRWHLWCDINNRSDEQTQIHNNIRSLALAGAAGYQSPGFRQQAGCMAWLETWGKTVGKDELAKILREQDVHRNSKYAAVLNKF